MTSRALMQREYQSDERQIPMELGRFVGMDQPATPSFAMKMQVHQLRKQVSALAGGASGAELAEILLEREEEIAQLVRENKDLMSRVSKAEHQTAAACAAAVARAGCFEDQEDVFVHKVLTRDTIQLQKAAVVEREAVEAYAKRERRERERLEKELAREATKRAREARDSAALAEQLNEAALAASQSNHVHLEYEDIVKRSEADRKAAELATQELVKCRQEFTVYCEELRAALEAQRLETDEHAAKADELGARCTELDADLNALHQEVLDLENARIDALAQRDIIQNEYDQVKRHDLKTQKQADDYDTILRHLQETQKERDTAITTNTELEARLIKERTEFETSLDQAVHERDAALNKYNQLRLKTRFQHDEAVTALEEARSEREAALNRLEEVRCHFEEEQAKAQEAFREKEKQLAEELQVQLEERQANTNRREIEAAVSALEEARAERDEVKARAEQARLEFEQGRDLEERRIEQLRQSLDRAREERDLMRDESKLLELKCRDLESERDQALAVADAALSNSDQNVQDQRELSQRMTEQCESLSAALAAKKAELKEAIAAKDMATKAAHAARNELDSARESLRKAVAHTTAERNEWATGAAKAREASASSSRQLHVEREGHEAADAAASAALSEIARAVDQASASASYMAARDAVLERERLTQAAREARQREAEYRRQADRAELRSQTSIHEIQQLRDELRDARKQLLSNNAPTPLSSHRLIRASDDDVALAARARMQTARILRDATERGDRLTKKKQDRRRLPAHLEEYQEAPPATPIKPFVDNHYLNTPTRAAGPGARVLTEITTTLANRTHLKRALKEGAPPKRPHHRTPKPPTSRSSMSSYVI